MNSKCYIFITNGINELGGLEQYVANKEAWLIETGWSVHIFSTVYSDFPFKVLPLNKYKYGVFPILSFAPYECPKILLKRNYNKILNCIGDFSGYSEIIIESHSGSTALWGELIANKLNAIHIMVPIHEVYEEKCYTQKRDFFIFKLNRREIFGGSIRFVRDVLKGDVTKTIPLKLQYNPIMDIDDDRLQLIKSADYTICYFGRTAKPYYRNILEGVYQFAAYHKDKTVQFVVVGKKEDHHKVQKESTMDTENLSIVLLGEMFPVPRALFTKVDVVCAGSGSARAAVYENVPIIIPDTVDYMANGVYGYDTFSSLNREETVIPTTFFEALEHTLVGKEYLEKEFKLEPIPPVSECCKEFFQYIKAQHNPHEYYDSKKIIHGAVGLRNRWWFAKLCFKQWKFIY